VAVRQPGAIPVFVRLKLRMLANRLHGSTGQVLLFLFGAAGAALFGGLGFLLFATVGLADLRAWSLLAGFGGTSLVLGSVLLPLLWFGIDDSLDPARFALLPVTRRRMVTGLLVAALSSLPAFGLLLATAGLLVPAGVHGGPGALLAQIAGVGLGLLLCVAAGRAVVNAFATMLRSRRMRDLAGILLAVLATMIGPGQLLLTSAVQQAELERLVGLAELLGWTPLAAPYTIGVEVAAGRPAAAGAKLLISVGTIALLLWWWSRTLESAMLGAATSGSTRTQLASGSPVTRLFPRLLRGLPATAFGAIAAREVRYWWRDPKRRANLITIVALGLLVPVLITAFGTVESGPGEVGFRFGPGVGDVSPMMLGMACLFVGSFAATVVANQFGFDASAYAAHLIIPVRGAMELRARTAGYALLVLPVLLVTGVLLALLQQDPQAALSAWGLLLAGFGGGMAVNIPMSVLAPYAMPEGANPFATSSGAGVAKSFLALVALVVSVVVAGPALLAAQLLPQVWPWLAVPVGGGYGLAAIMLSCYIAGDLLEHRRPQLFAAITEKG
jgi:ABC-2 type transport system permease protein